jgi:hypothetical protein
VLFPLLPDKLAPSEEMDLGVKFDGYLIYLYRYHAAKGNLKTPLLIGPTVQVANQAPAADRSPSPVSGGLLYLIFGFLGLVVLLVVGLSWWFRRGDRKVRDHLAQLRAQRTIEMLDQEQAVDRPESNGAQEVGGGS